MTDRITLPGAEWLRECSPGVLLEHEGAPAHLIGSKGVVGRIINGEASMMLVPLETVVIVPLEAVALDLTHETGRDHAARGLWASSEDLTERPCTAPEWLYCPDGVWSLGASVRDVPGEVQFTTYGPVGSGADEEIAGLADIDGKDSVLLPDGSRRADALALQAVCLHGGGR